jgi:hypothetical protein
MSDRSPLGEADALSRATSSLASGALVAASNVSRLVTTTARLLPPRGGPSVVELMAEAPSVHAGSIVSDRWLGELASRVRQGLVSPEQALLAACLYGERRAPVLVPEPAAVPRFVSPARLGKAQP